LTVSLHSCIVESQTHADRPGGLFVNILIAGETSGRIRNAFRRLGHDACSCDLLPAVDGPNYHIQADMFHVLGYGCWDMLIAHPTCTYLTVSAEWAYADIPMIKGKPRNIKVGTLTGAQRLTARETALEDVRRLMGSGVGKICIENPVGKIGTGIRPADQYIQPYQFGHDASKRTGLWLTGLPRLSIPPEEEWIAPRIVEGKKRWANQTDSGQNRLGPSANRWSVRSETYQGWADAMAAQWG